MELFQKNCLSSIKICNCFAITGKSCVKKICWQLKTMKVNLRKKNFFIFIYIVIYIKHFYLKIKKKEIDLS